MTKLRWMQCGVAFGILVSGLVAAHAARASGLCPNEGICSGNPGSGGHCPWPTADNCNVYWQGSFCGGTNNGPNPLPCTQVGLLSWGSQVTGPNGNLSSGNWIATGEGDGTAMMTQLNAAPFTGGLAFEQWLCMAGLAAGPSGPTCYVADTSDDGTSVYSSDGSCSTSNGGEGACAGNCSGSTYFEYEQEICVGADF